MLSLYYSLIEVNTICFSIIKGYTVYVADNPNNRARLNRSNLYNTFISYFIL